MNPQPNAHMRLPTLTDEVHLEGDAIQKIADRDDDPAPESSAAPAER